MGISPSTQELAEFIRIGEPVKPVRFVRSGDPGGKFAFDLVEGRLRYWAYVIVFDSANAVPAYICSDSLLPEKIESPVEDNAND